jgi:dTMP kinase
MDFEWLSNLEKGLPKEDIVIVLDIDPSISHKRSIDNDFVMDVFENDKRFLDKVRETYLDLAKLLKWNVVQACGSDPVSIMNSIVKIICLDS